MFRTTLPLLVGLLAAAPAAAQTDPDEFLSARTQIYLRWDGKAAHHDAYQKTAVGQMMQGDMGRLFDAVADQFKNIPIPPDQKEAVDALKRLGGHVLQNGFVFAVEVVGVNPPDARLTLVLPKAGGDLPAVQKLIATAAEKDKSIKVEQETVAGKAVQSIAFPGGHFFTFASGGHAVVVVGTDEPKRYLTAKRGDPITGSALYKAVHADAGFPTTTFGYVDIAGLLEVARGVIPPDAAGVIESLGLAGLKAVRYRGGYDGRAVRSQLEIQTDRDRKGLVKLLGSGKPMSLTDLPPLPADLLRFEAGSEDLVALYDSVVQTFEAVTRLDPKALAQVRDGAKQVDAALGVSLRNDILAELAGPAVHYASPGENFLLSGHVLAFKVKDGEKLQRSLGAAVTNLGKKFDAPVKVVAHRYHDATFHEVNVSVPGYFVAPTYTVSNGWLVVGLYPQPVQGFVLRQAGKLPAWKPPQGLQPSLQKLPKEFTRLWVSDPRPGVRNLLALLPPAAAAVRSMVPQMQGFDVGLIPNGHEATRPLFPNVTVATDDGSVLRVDSMSSVVLPFPLDLFSETPGAALLMLGSVTALGRGSVSTFERVAPRIEPGPRPMPPVPEKPRR
jgi:hypothetical protein